MASGDRQSGEEVGSMLVLVFRFFPGAKCQVKRGEGEFVRVGVRVQFRLC
jgi:hypothetical protein